MRFTTTTGHLINMMAEIQSLQQQGSVLTVLLNSRMVDFLKYNQIRADSAMEKARKIEKDFFEHDENGKIKYGEDKKPVLLPGKTYEESQRLTDEIMMAPVEIVA